MSQISHHQVFLIEGNVHVNVKKLKAFSRKLERFAGKKTILAFKIKHKNSATNKKDKFKLDKKFLR